MIFSKFDPDIKEKISEYLTKLLNSESIISIDIVGKRKNRSNKQNAWLWGCVYPMLLYGLNDIGWEYFDTEQVHEFCKKRFTKDQVVNFQTGEIESFPRSTSIMSTSEFFAYCDLIRDYATEYVGIDIPEPDPEWRKKETQINIDKE